MSIGRGSLVGLAIVVLSPAAFADTDTGGEQKIEARDFAADAAFTPAIVRATGRGRALAVGAMTLNGAKNNAALDLNGELRVISSVRLVLQVSNIFDRARPGVGGGIQWLDERRHGVAASVYLLYKAEGFSEPEGEIEAMLSFGKQLGPLRGTFNLAYGQDPEAKERDGEVAVALHTELVPRLFGGVVGRYRDALGSAGEAGVIRDMIAGATATYTFGKVGVTVTGGVAGFATETEPMKIGPAGVLSIGSAF